MTLILQNIFLADGINTQKHYLYLLLSMKVESTTALR